MDQAGQINFKGPSQSQDKQLILIKLGHHYHAYTSLSVFLEKATTVWSAKKDLATMI